MGLGGGTAPNQNGRQGGSVKGGGVGEARKNGRGRKIPFIVAAHGPNERRGDPGWQGGRSDGVLRFSQLRVKTPGGQGGAGGFRVSGKSARGLSKNQGGGGWGPGGKETGGMGRPPVETRGGADFSVLGDGGKPN